MRRTGHPRTPGRRLAALALLVALGAVACAAHAPAQAPAPARPRAANGAPGARGYVPADSGPSAAALKVLETFPEPLAAAQRVAAPGAGADSAVADSTARDAPADSTGAGSGAEADSAAGAPPVPAPTRPLGDTTRSVPSYEEPAATVPATPPATPAPATSAAALPDTCWAVQIASPAEKARAETLRDAAQSLLLVRMTIEPAKGRHGVRTSDCLSGATADSLRRRALASGFKDAFRVKWVRVAAKP